MRLSSTKSFKMAALKILREQVEQYEVDNKNSFKIVHDKLETMDTSSYVEVTNNEGTISKVDKFDFIMSSLQKIWSRLDTIDQSANTGDNKAILEKIEEKGNEVAAANKEIADSIKKDVEQIKTVVIKRLVTYNKTINTKLTANEQRIIELEKQVYKNDQHSRKVNFELDGLPQHIGVNDTKELKAAALQVFQHAGVRDLSNDSIEIIHRIKSKRTPQPVIIKARRDFIDNVFEKRKEIIDVGKNHMGYENKLYVNPNLCPAYSKLAYNCRQLKKEHYILDTWFSNYTLKIKTPNNVIKTIGHEIDLYRFAPKFDKFSFDTEVYATTNTADELEEELREFYDS